MIITDKQVLRQISKPTSVEEVKTLNLKQQIIDAMKSAWVPGIGLAAIQIGIPLRYGYIFIQRMNGKIFELELINPVITRREQRFINPYEGCLSIPNKWTNTNRFYDITFSTVTSGGVEELRSVSGIEALAVQHEIDHMNGILNTDRDPEPYNNGRNDLCGCGSGKKYKKCCLGGLREDIS